PLVDLDNSESIPYHFCLGNTPIFGTQTILRHRVSWHSVALMMFFIVKRGRIAPLGVVKGVLTMFFIVKVWLWGRPRAFSDEKHR
ncbi:hypothetical protein, partial [Paenibacillus eucommiae]